MCFHRAERGEAVVEPDIIGDALQGRLRDEGADIIDDETADRRAGLRRRASCR